MLRSIEANPGDKASALEQIGEKALGSAAKLTSAARDTAKPLRAVDRTDPFAIDPASLRAGPGQHGMGRKAPQIATVPEKTIEFGL